MATFLPFKALRPAGELAGRIACLPYDVITEAEAEALYRADSCCFVKVIRSEVCFPEGTDPYCNAVYEKANENLNEMREKGELALDTTPCYYLYEQTMGEVKQTGVAALAEAGEYLNKTIKRHEHTLKEKQLDRTKHFMYTNAQTEPVFFFHKDTPEFNDFVEECKQHNAPVYDFTRADKTRHRLFAVDKEADKAYIKNFFAELPALYIADGHHRTASIADVSEAYEKNNLPIPSGADKIMAVSFPVSRVNVMDYNRLVKDTGEYTKEEFLAKLSADFTLEPLESFKANKKHDFALYILGRYYKMTAKPGSFDENSVLESLDASILQNNVFEKILGISDPTATGRLSFVGGIRGYKYLTDRVDSGEYAFCVMLCPVDPYDIMSAADSDLTMPPKSTWFEPKLLSGLFIHIF